MGDSVLCFWLSRMQQVRLCCKNFIEPEVECRVVLGSLSPDTTTLCMAVCPQSLSGQVAVLIQMSRILLGLEGPTDSDTSPEDSAMSAQHEEQLVRQFSSGAHCHLQAQWHM